MGEQLGWSGVSYWKRRKREKSLGSHKLKVDSNVERQKTVGWPKWREYKARWFRCFSVAVGETLPCVTSGMRVENSCRKTRELPFGSRSVLKPITQIEMNFMKGFQWELFRRAASVVFTCARKQRIYKQTKRCQWIISSFFKKNTGISSGWIEKREEGVKRKEPFCFLPEGFFCTLKPATPVTTSLQYRLPDPTVVWKHLFSSSPPAWWSACKHACYFVWSW